MVIFEFFYTRSISAVAHCTSLVSILSPQKKYNIFKLEFSFVLPSLVAPLSWQVDGIVGQTNILSNPPFHMDHSDAIY